MAAASVTVDMVVKTAQLQTSASNKTLTYLQRGYLRMLLVLFSRMSLSERTVDWSSRLQSKLCFWYESKQRWTSTSPTISAVPLQVYITTWRRLLYDQSPLVYGLWSFDVSPAYEHDQGEKTHKKYTQYTYSIFRRNIQGKKYVRLKNHDMLQIFF